MNDEHDPEDMERRAFVTVFLDRCEARAPLKNRGFLTHRLLDYVGWQEGLSLTDPRAQELLKAPRQRWLWDRTTRLLVSVSHAHPVFANQLAECITSEELNVDDAEYMTRGFGFWHSSVATPNSLHLPEGFEFTPEERRVFGHYKIFRW